MKPLSENTLAAPHKSRLFTLDYLRGIAACSIMLYHYSIDVFGDFTADSVVKKIGIYGVIIFYVLSGLTLFHVYFSSMEFNYKGISSFFLKRLFRIFPLLWLVMLVTIFLKGSPGLEIIFLNITGLFSIFKWDAYIGKGVWSIGNELVFYLFLPLMVFLGRKSKSLLVAFFLLVLAVTAYFTFLEVSKFQTLGAGWKTYINPVNQGLNFLAGFLIGYFTKNLKFSNAFLTVILIASALLFVFIPVSGDAINLVIGYTRFIYIALCVLICFALYKLNYGFPAFIDKPLSILGEISYSLYLLHPIVWIFVQRASKYSEANFFYIPVSIRFLAAVVFSLGLSYFIYVTYEKYFMRLGSKTIAKLTSRYKIMQAKA